MPKAPQAKRKERKALGDELAPPEPADASAERVKQRRADRDAKHEEKERETLLSAKQSAAILSAARAQQRAVKVDGQTKHPVAVDELFAGRGSERRTDFGDELLSDEDEDDEELELFVYTGCRDAVGPCIVGRGLRARGEARA